MSWSVHHGDCLEWLRSLPDNCADAMVTDPPAGISFMGKGWDGDKGGRRQWIAWLADVMTEARRVLKPGAHALVWALPRTSHWTGNALEDAGLEVRDQVFHLFGSGFPKSHNIAIALDKAAGAMGHRGKAHSAYAIGDDFQGRDLVKPAPTPSHEPITEAARQWQGWGTALKPAAEVWWLARVPLSGTVADNVTTYGVGGLNVDGCRVPGNVPQVTQGLCSAPSSFDPRTERRQSNPHAAGRWPPHVTLTHDAACGDRCVEGCPVRVLDRQSGGTASRFFHRFRYQPKPSTRERSAGMINRNTHPTVKALGLMRWLCRLITPPGGVVLDPFTGSGSTGCGALLEGFQFMGAEQDENFHRIARARLAHYAGEELPPEVIQAKVESGHRHQLSLFGGAA